jgi:DNA-binding transcriptional MocR family regulator
MDDVLGALRAGLTDPSAKGVARAVSRAVRDGTLPPGTRLPPIRSVAAALALSPTTVSAGWALLARAGTIRTDGRRGTTVTETVTHVPGRYRRALERQTDFALDLSTGVPDGRLLPSLQRSLEQLTTAGTPGGYLDEPVLPELLGLLRADWPYDAQELTVVDGAMDALDLVSRSLLRFGDRVVVEHPCFPPLLDLLESIGAEVVGVPMDDEGLLPDALAAALATSPTAAVFLQPRAQNPTGVSLTATRAADLAVVLARAGVPVVEDDSAGAISTAPDVSLGAWIPEQTVHVRSYSKSHGPDLRLAGLSGPTELLRDALSRRQLGQGWSSRLLQRILVGLLTDDDAVAHVDRARLEYARRRAAVVAALGGHGIDVPGSDGLNIWVPVHDETAAVVRLASQGIGVTPGTPFDVVPGGGGHIRVTTGLMPEGHEELAATLAGAANTSGWGQRAR